MFDLLIFYMLLSSVVAVLLFVWFKTDAFTEYLSLFGLGRFLLVNDWIEAVKDDPGLSYPAYLIYCNPNFFNRLISCSNCLVFYISAGLNFSIFIVLSLLLSPFILILYPVSVLVTVYFSLSLYYLLVRLVK